MKLYIATTLLLLCQLSARAEVQPPNLDSMYNCLDDAIAHADVYFARKELRIAALRSKLKAARNVEARYRISHRLYEEYKPFVSDSAIYFLNECVALARKAGRQERVGECLSLLSLCCSSTGLYDESRSFLARVDTAVLNRRGLAAYYHACYNLNNELAYYSSIRPMKKVYQAETARYEKRLLSCVSENDDVALLVRELRLMSEGRRREAMALNTKWLELVEKGSHRYALVALYRYLEYKAAEDTTHMMYWLAESALADVRNGVMDQGSMWEMANQLMLQGDVDRSYRYISFTSGCANRYGSRQRSWQISPLMSAIADNYKRASESKNHQLTLMLVVISVLAVVILFILFYVNRQRKKLAVARKHLSRKNRQLSVSNGKLSAANEQLSMLNLQLSESNRVKEEYVGRFMRLCSLNIDKMDAFRKQVNRMVKNRDYENLYQVTRSRKSQEMELDAFYEDFDKAFLHLFPNFVGDFNSLLRPEEQIEVPEKGRMTTTLRIFALIRLGIDDSGKIAEFLHYSVNTIYNYRARTKNGAIADREHFERHVKELGLPRS